MNRAYQHVRQHQQKRSFRPMQALPAGLGSSDSPGWRFRPQPFTIRVTLEEQVAEALASLGPRGIAQKLRSAPAPFNELRSAEVRHKTLFLYGVNTKLETQIRRSAIDLFKLLGLSYACTILQERFYVKAVGFDVDQEDLKDTNSLLEEWCLDNHVKIQSDFWSYQKLILVLDRVEDAVALCKSVVFLNGYWGHVVPYDIRARPRLCWKCGKSGHMKEQCMQPKFDCLKCGDRGDHDLWQCRSKRKLCLTCGGSHETYSPKCQHESVLSMFAQCAFYEEIGPSWAAALSQHVSTDQTAFRLNKRSRLPEEGESGPSKQIRTAPDVYMPHRRETEPYREHCPSYEERARMEAARGAATPDTSIALSRQDVARNGKTQGGPRRSDRLAASTPFSYGNSMHQFDSGDETDGTTESVGLMVKRPTRSAL